MMSEIRFYASGNPKGQPRPRAFSMKGHVRVYDPGTAEGWKSEVASAARPFVPENPINGPIGLCLEFFFERPKNHRRANGALKESAPGYHTNKPDVDNIAKAIMDALTTLRFWNDDSTVSDLRVRKLYVDWRNPGCLISIRELI